MANNQIEVDGKFYDLDKVKFRGCPQLLCLETSEDIRCKMINYGKIVKFTIEVEGKKFSAKIPIRYFCNMLNDGALEILPVNFYKKLEESKNAES